jgi:hypothetical protein
LLAVPRLHAIADFCSDLGERIVSGSRSFQAARSLPFQRTWFGGLALRLIGTALTISGVLLRAMTTLFD